MIKLLVIVVIIIVSRTTSLKQLTFYLLNRLHLPQINATECHFGFYDIGNDAFFILSHILFYFKLCLYNSRKYGYLCFVSFLKPCQYSQEHWRKNDYKKNGKKYNINDFNLPFNLPLIYLWDKKLGRRWEEFHLFIFSPFHLLIWVFITNYILRMNVSDKYYYFTYIGKKVLREKW